MQMLLNQQSSCCLWAPRYLNRMRQPLHKRAQGACITSLGSLQRQHGPSWPPHIMWLHCMKVRHSSQSLQTIVPVRLQHTFEHLSILL